MRKIKICIFSILFIIGGYLFFRKFYKPIKPVLGFKVESTSFEINNEIVFSDTSKVYSKREWYFGDNTSTSSYPRETHLYTKPSKYKVTLILEDSIKIEKIILINPTKIKEEPWSNFEYTPKDITVGQKVLFKDLTKNAKSWEWRFGESNDMSVNSKEKNPSYIYKTGGIKTISLITNGDYKSIVKLQIYISKYPKPWICGYPSDEIIRRTQRTNKPELKSNEKSLHKALLGISQNKLSYRNFAKYFCKFNMPEVHIKNGSIISLKEFDESVRGKNIEIKEPSFEKDKNGCVTKLYINHQVIK